MGIDFFDGGSQALISRHGRDKKEKRTFKFQTQRLTLLASCSKPVLPN